MPGSFSGASVTIDATPGSGAVTFTSTIDSADVASNHLTVNVDGDITFNGVNVRRVRNVYGLRRRIGVVFPLPVGLPLSVYDNVALAQRLAGGQALEVGDAGDRPDLVGGQQERQDDAALSSQQIAHSDEQGHHGQHQYENFKTIHNRLPQCQKSKILSHARSNNLFNIV